MGSLKNKINELEERIKNNRKAIAELDDMFYKFSGPKGYPTGTSWQDYDCIRGGNKEMDLFKYVTERERLKTIIENKLLELMNKRLIHDYDIDTTLSGFKLIVYIILNYRKYYLWFDNINSIENLEQNIKNKISKEIIEKL